VADQIPPILKVDYTARERALIAGYLLGKRKGTQQALDSAKKAPPGETFGWGEGNVAYYTHALAYSRWLLYKIGYPLGKEGANVP
jgi:hypothetical protein